MPDVNQMRQQFYKNKQQEIDRQFRGQQQEADDVINRRMSALGQAGSGAAIGAQLKARDTINAQRQAAVNDLGAQELQANIQAQERLDDRNFAMLEAQKGRDFQADQAKVGRDFEAGQAQVGRDFAAGESALGRQFQSGLADKDMAFKRGLFDIEQGNKLKELDMAERQFLMDKETTEFNKRLAAISAGRPDLYVKDTDPIIARISQDQLDEQERQRRLVSDVIKASTFRGRKI